MANTKKSYVWGTGRRKTAIAQVRLYAGSGSIVIDGKSLEERFPVETQRITICKPLNVTDTLNKYDIEVKTCGGGVSGQADAISLGIARALLKEDEALKEKLRAEGLLTRDPRAKERKKPGLKRARKDTQYTKR
jgi:small subunit ribosomal protein S9